MVDDRRWFSVRYRKLDDPQGLLANFTLQELLVQAMAHTVQKVTIGGDPELRAYTESPEYGTLLLNDFNVHEHYFFGQLVRYEPGSTLPLVNMSRKRNFYNLEQANSPEGYEPLRGICYFIAIRNHFFVIEDDFTTKRSEEYLTWLLSTLTQVAPRDAKVLLTPILTGPAGQDLRLAEINKIAFKPSPLDHATAVESKLDSTTQSRSASVDQGSVLNVLIAAGLHETDLYKLTQGNNQIELTLEIRFKQDRSIRTLGSSEVARLLRDMPEDELTLYGPDGRERNGQVLQLSQKERIRVVGKFISTQDAIATLFQKYRDFVKNGYIGR